MTDIKIYKPGALERFDPERHRLKVAALDYTIEEAKRIKDWPALEEAIDIKIEEQHRFIAWWGVEVTDKGGRPRKTGPGTRTGLSAADAEDLTGLSKQRVSDLGTKLENPDKYRERLLGAEYRAAFLEELDNVRGTTGTGENEWFTPARYLDLARAVMGGIDLDPASSDLAQQAVQATRYFTKQDSGLLQPWHGRVWLNPPYAQPLIAQFVSKLVAEHAAGRVSEAILLTHNYTDTAFFHEAASRAAAICFTRGRIYFYEADGTTGRPTQGQAFTYFGTNVDGFASAFGDVGFVVIPYAWS